MLWKELIYRSFCRKWVVYMYTDSLNTGCFNCRTEVFINQYGSDSGWNVIIQILLHVTTLILNRKAGLFSQILSGCLYKSSIVRVIAGSLYACPEWFTRTFMTKRLLSLDVKPYPSDLRQFFPVWLWSLNMKIKWMLRPYKQNAVHMKYNNNKLFAY